MKKVATTIAFLAVAILTGCASPAALITAGDYCKGQAQMAVSRASMADRSPLSGNPSDNIRDAVYKDCLIKVTK